MPSWLYGYMMILYIIWLTSINRQLIIWLLPSGNSSMWSLLTTKPPHRYRAGRDTSRSRLVSHGPAIGRVSLALGLPLVLGIQDIEILTIKPLLIVLKIGVLPSIVSSRNLLGIFIKKHSFFLSPYRGVLPFCPWTYSGILWCLDSVLFPRDVLAMLFWLVVDLPLWKIWKSMGRMTSHILWKNMENKKWSKPPTSFAYTIHFLFNPGSACRSNCGFWQLCCQSCVRIRPGGNRIGPPKTEAVSIVFNMVFHG